MKTTSAANTGSTSKKNGFTLIELLIVFAILTMLAGMIARVNLKHGVGQKVGQVVKVNYEGVINDTWEAELIRGGMNNGSGAFGATTFHFTIEGDEMAKQVQMYMKNQTEVVIRYRIEGIYSPFRSGSNGVFLLSIEPQGQTEK